MGFYSTVKYKNQLWKYIWFNLDPGLKESVKDDLMNQIVDMYHDGDDIRHVDNKEYCARIIKKDRTNLGMFAGNRFDAEFETDKINKSRLSILLLDVIDPMSN